MYLLDVFINYLEKKVEMRTGLFFFFVFVCVSRKNRISVFCIFFFSEKAENLFFGQNQIRRSSCSVSFFFFFFVQAMKSDVSLGLAIPIRIARAWITLFFVRMKYFFAWKVRMVSNAPSLGEVI